MIALLRQSRKGKVKRDTLGSHLMDASMLYIHSKLKKMKIMLQCCMARCSRGSCYFCYNEDGLDSSVIPTCKFLGSGVMFLQVKGSAREKFPLTFYFLRHHLSFLRAQHVEGVHFHLSSSSWPASPDRYDKTVGKISLFGQSKTLGISRLLKMRRDLENDCFGIEYISYIICMNFIIYMRGVVF